MIPLNFLLSPSIARVTKACSMGTPSSTPNLSIIPDILSEPKVSIDRLPWKEKNVTNLGLLDDLLVLVIDCQSADSHDVRFQQHVTLLFNH